MCTPECRSAHVEVQLAGTSNSQGYNTGQGWQQARAPAGTSDQAVLGLAAPELSCNSKEQEVP